ncbi:MAG TPA: GntR family transcriptional regulator, partial [Steroidobacteraceae bacterium]|nr:GntR family transcriptional regulator [Steroidobacteraceae bacterium]
MDALFEIDLQLPAARGGAARALGAQLKKAIAAGRLAPGSKLPATRQAVRLLGVSRNTAAAVYEQLACEGYLVSRRGSGTYVAPRAAPARRPAHAGTAYPLNEFWQRADIAAAIGFWRERTPSPPAADGARGVELRPGLVDATLFPFETFRQLNARRLRSLERNPADYKSPQGHQGSYHLRSAITRYVALTRAVACDRDDVLVTSGAQQAFDLLARVLVTAGRTVVAIEDPGYPPLRVP